MKWLLCRVLGHQRTLMAFTSNRFSCRRCGADLGRDIPVMPSPPAATLTHREPRASAPLRESPEERSFPFRTNASGTRRPLARP